MATVMGDVIGTDQIKLISQTRNYRFGIHNVQLVGVNESLSDVDPRVYALVQEAEPFLSGNPINGPLYSTVHLFDPNEADCAESEEGNSWS